MVCLFSLRIPWKTDMIKHFTSVKNKSYKLLKSRNISLVSPENIFDKIILDALKPELITCKTWCLKVFRSEVTSL